MKFKNIYFFLIIYCGLFSQTFADILFSEIFPNTVDDSNLEYIELYNSGNSVEYLEGYILKDKSGKEFIFDSGDTLDSGEYKRFLRSYTKIILNNSDEELYLSDDNGNLIDSLNYSTSVKGEVINVLEEQTSSQPSPLEERGQDNDIDGNIVSPEIVYTFQSPTYLVEKDSIRSVYNCDTNREECKINLDLRDSFISGFSYSDFDCDINFGFITGQENKCNPSTITIPKGTYSFIIKINSKNYPDKKSVKHLIVINKGYQKIVKNRNSSGKIINENVIKDIEIIKPKILIESGIKDNGECRNKRNCRVNLKYLTKNKLERCLWDFSEGTFEGWNKFMCNPGIINYGAGDFVVKLKVYEDNNPDNFKTSELDFTNQYILNIDISNINNSAKVNVLIKKVMPNPAGSDEFEYVELINNGDEDFNLKGCSLDDIIEGGTNPYDFLDTDILLTGKNKKFYKEVTKINFNNDSDEVNLYCGGKIIDKLKWDFKIKDGYYLDHSRLDIFSGKVKVLDVIDGDTIKIEFIESGKIEKLRLIGIDSPETKHPDKEVQKFGIYASNYVKNELIGKEVLIEIDPTNFRDIYSRLLGYIYIDGNSFNEKLIKLGYAKAYLNYEFKYSDVYKKAELTAKKDNLGLWASNIDLTDSLEEELVINNDLSKIESIISIQGKVGKNKIINGNTITCIGTCSINFDGNNSIGKIKKYNWDFGNGEKFEGVNPGYIKYEKYGSYKVFLAVIGSEGDLEISNFNVSYIKKVNNKKTSIIPKVEAEDSYKEKVIINIEKDNEEEYIEGKNSIIYYILIGVFSLFLIVMLLWKEKLV